MLFVIVLFDGELLFKQITFRPLFCCGYRDVEISFLMEIKAHMCSSNIILPGYSSVQIRKETIFSLIFLFLLFLR